MRTIVIVLVVALVVWALVALVLLGLGRRLPLRSLIRFGPQLLWLVRGLVRDPRVPRSSKLVLGAAAVWIASPIDLIPEFLPLIGPVDDVVVGVLALRHVVRRAGPEVVREHWRGDEATLRLILRAAGAPRPRPD